MGCTLRPTSSKIRKIEPDCTNANEQIEMLDKEMIRAHEKILSGVASVLPSAAVVSLLSGRWTTNVQIASGEYEKIIDAKIKEIADHCGIDYTSKMTP